MVIKGPSSKPKKKMMEEDEEDVAEMEGEDTEEESSDYEHIEAAKEGASELRSALEGDDKEAAMAALDKIESHLEQCAA